MFINIINKYTTKGVRPGQSFFLEAIGIAPIIEDDR
jgi:hypothetical protein